MTDGKDTGPRARITPPPYTDFEAKEREQFLSELGNFTPPQREIFHTLCKTWQPEIPYNRFLTQVQGSIKNASHEIDRLMEKLSEKRCGLIVLRFEDSEAKKDKIILTEQGDRRYYFHRLRNEMETFYASPQEPLPLEAALEEKGLSVPPVFYENLSADDFSRIFTEQPSEDFSLYRVVLATGDAVFLPSGGGTRFINACLTKMREYFANTNLLAEAARIKETSLAEMKKRIESKDPIFWLDLSRSVLGLRSDPLFLKKVQVDAGLFLYSDILSRFIENHLAELRRRKIEQEEREKDLEALAMQIENEKERLIGQERFNELLGTVQEKYGKEHAEEIRKEFLGKYLETGEKTKLPAIVSLKGKYIHRNNFYDFFIGSLFGAREVLGEEYLKEMEHLLKTNNRERKTIFYSRENFETDIIDRLRNVDPFLSEVFGKPRLLAEAVIHTVKEKRKNKNLNDLKEELEKYFKPDSMEFKSLPLIFGLAVIDIFNRSFTRLPFWRQIWLKITGKYKSYQNQYFGLGGRPAATGKIMASGNPARPGASSETVKADFHEPRIVRSRDLRKKREPSVKNKAYSKKQQESAWEEFSKSLKPKKK